MIKLLSQYWNSQGFKKLFFNTSWLLSEKVLKMVAGLLVGILVARYLGPEQFGVLSYAISLVTMIMMLNHLGLDGLTVRELVKYPDNSKNIIGTVFYLKLAASLIAGCIIVLVAYATSEPGSQVYSLLLIMSLYCFFEPKIVVDYWFESTLQARYSTISKSTSLFMVSVIKLFLVFGGLGLIWFGAVFVLEIMLAAIIGLYFLANKTPFSLRSCKFDSDLAKSMLSRGWMVMFGAIFASIYRKVDQTMLMWMTEETEVGIYAVAAQLSEIWSFVPVAIVASLFPGLVRLKDTESDTYDKRLQQIFDLLAFLAFGLAIATTLIAVPLVTLLYGVEYAAAADILVIHIWSCMFIFLRALFSRWIHLEQVFLFSMVTQGVGALANVGLNLWLIPSYGGYGAAISTFISYGLASFVILFFHKKSRPVFFMMCRSLFILFRGPFLVRQLLKKEF